MDISLSRIVDLVAISLGEYPDWKKAASSIGHNCPLNEMVEITLMPATFKVVGELPLMECSHLIDMSIHIHNSTDWGFENIYPCELPENFMRLHSFRMPDWPGIYSENILSDPLRAGLGERAPDWLLKRSTRPFIEIIPADNSSPGTLRFGPSKFTSPEVALYVPRPYYDSSSSSLCDFQPAALSKLIDSIAQFIK